MSDLTSLSIAALRDGFRSGEFTAREIAEQYNAAVAGARSLNAYTVETPEDALAAAEAADKARGGGHLGSLAGIPLGIKDLFATRGVDTTAGSRILKDFRPPYESTVTANLRKVGAETRLGHGRSLRFQARGVAACLLSGRRTTRGWCAG